MKRKALLTASILLVTMLFLNGCSKNKTPYEQNDQDGYRVTVKYDANGGYFTDSTTIITDSYNITEIKTNDQGKVDIALLAPDDQQRGKGNWFSPSKTDHFLLGWYTERTEVVGNDGNVEYAYSGYWDFNEDILSVDPTGEYSSAEPELTLYAVWKPVLRVEFYDVNSDELRGELTYNPTDSSEIMLPYWDENTGAIDMEKFPKRDGYTFNGAYYDKAGTMPIEGESFAHSALVNYENATVENTTMKLYVDWIEGDWYHIHTAEQLVDNAKLSGNYVLESDLDFTEEIWPSTFMHKNFAGTIVGQGHKIQNVELTQTDAKQMNAGLFGSIASEAAITDVNFDNISFTIKGGAQTTGSNFGLLAGNISDDAVLAGITITNSTLKIDSNAYFGVDDYSIGLLCGMGDTDIDYSGITCVATGKVPESVIITVEGDVVTVEIDQQV